MRAAAEAAGSAAGRGGDVEGDGFDYSGLCRFLLDQRLLPSGSGKVPFHRRETYAPARLELMRAASACAAVPVRIASAGTECVPAKHLAALSLAFKESRGGDAMGEALRLAAMAAKSTMFRLGAVSGAGAEGEKEGDRQGLKTYAACLARAAADAERFELRVAAADAVALSDALRLAEARSCQEVRDCAVVSLLSLADLLQDEDADVRHAAVSAASALATVAGATKEGRRDGRLDAVLSEQSALFLCFSAATEPRFAGCPRLWRGLSVMLDNVDGEGEGKGEGQQQRKAGEQSAVDSDVFVSEALISYSDRGVGATLAAVTIEKLLHKSVVGEEVEAVARRALALFRASPEGSTNGADARIVAAEGTL